MAKGNPALAPNLFDFEEPATVIDVDLVVSKDHAVTAHIPGFESMAPATQKALGDVVQSVVALAQEVLDTSSHQGAGPAKAADSFALGRLEDQWPHAYAFVAQARKHGLTDPALTPVQVSTAGRREFDLAELARYANDLLRGVRSIKPTMTPERWAQATAKAREIGGKS